MRISTALVLLASSSIVSASTLAQSVSCRSTDEKEIAALFDHWNNSLKTGNPKRVVDNYAVQSVLLPTLFNTPRLTPAAKEDYFVHFLAKKPVGRIDCTTAFDTGLYTSPSQTVAKSRRVTPKPTSGTVNNG